MLLYWVAVILNYSVNCLLIYISSCYVSAKIPWKRIALASGFSSIVNHLIGKIYPTIAYGEFIIFLVSAVCAFAVYKKNKHKLRGVGIYILLQIIVILFSDSLKKEEYLNLFIIFACVLLIKQLSVSNLSKEDVVDIEICHNEKTVKLKALRDTGNFLVDPLTGRSVVLVGADAAKLLTGLSRSQISDPVSTIGKNIYPGLRLLPFHTIGKTNGMLLAYKFKDVKIGDERGSRLVAFVSDGLSGEHGYQALTGGRI